MKVVNKNITLPIPLVEWSIRNKVLLALRLQVILLMYSSGKIRYKNETLSFIRKNYFKSNSSYYDQLNLLKELGWVNRSLKSNFLFINGMSFIMDDLNLEFKPGRVQLEIDYLSSFTEFAYSSIIGNQMNFLKYKAKKGGQQAELIKWNSYKLVDPKALNYLGISVKTMARLTGYKKSQADRLKKKSIQLGFMSVKNRIGYLVKRVDGINVTIGCEELPVIIKAFPKLRAVWRCNPKNNRIFQILHDEVKVNLIFKRRSYRQTFMRLKNSEKRDRC